MTKRSVQQNKVVAYALLRGKLVPRDEVLKHQLGIQGDVNPSEIPDPQAVGLSGKSNKELKAMLDEKGIEYKGNASRTDLIQMLEQHVNDVSKFEIKGGENEK